MEYSILTTAGVIAGILTSLYGLGGGLTIVPALLYCLPLFNVGNAVIMQVAVGTSLAIMLVNSLFSLFTHAATKNVRWKLACYLLPYIILGTIIGALVAHLLSSKLLLLLFILLQVIVIIRFIIQHRNKHNTQIKVTDKDKNKKKFESLANCIYGTLTGIIAACFGGGSSLIMVPYLKSIGLVIKEAAAIVVALNVFVGITATIIYSFLKVNSVGLPHYSTGYIFLPAFLLICIGSFIGVPVGTFAVNRLSERSVTNTFLLVLLIIFISTFAKFIMITK